MIFITAPLPREARFLHLNMAQPLLNSRTVLKKEWYVIVKSLLVLLAVTLLTPLAALAQTDGTYETLAQISQGIQEGRFETLSPQAQATFTKLIVEARDILYSQSAGSQYICASQGNGYFKVTSTDNGSTFGENVYGLDTCKETLPSPGTDFTCLSHGNGYFNLTQLPSGKTFGSTIYGISTCQNLLPQPGQKFACVSQGNGYFQITNLQTGATLGSSVYGLDTCRAQLP